MIFKMLKFLKCINFISPKKLILDDEHENLRYWNRLKTLSSRYQNLFLIPAGVHLEHLVYYYVNCSSNDDLIALKVKSAELSLNNRIYNVLVSVSNFYQRTSPIDRFSFSFRRLFETVTMAKNDTVTRKYREAVRDFFMSRR